MQRPRDVPGMWLRVAMLAAGLLGALCTPTLAQDCAPARLENSVTMEPAGEQHLMTVRMTLDGLEKRFLFDTGGVMDYVSSAVVEELKLPQFPSAPLLDLRGNRSDSAVDVKDVTLGTAKGSFIRFQVASDLAFDGILSVRTTPRDRLLADQDLDMDFGGLKLNFYSADHCAGDVVYWPHQSLAVVPVTAVQGHIELPVLLDGHRLTAAIDTGAPWTTLSLARAQEKLGFSPAASRPSGVIKDDPGKQVYFRRFAALSFEGVTVANPLIIVRPVQFGGKDEPTILASRAQHVSDNANRLAPDIIIGMEILRNLHVYYAVKEQKLYITPAGTG